MNQPVQDKPASRVAAEFIWTYVKNYGPNYTFMSELDVIDAFAELIEEANVLQETKK